MRYSLAFRNGVLRKVLPPENRSVYQVAKEAGVSPTTIHSWMSKLKEGKLELTPEGTDPTPRDWPVSQKFRLLMEGRQLPAEARGEWLRTNGLHSEHLSLWEQELSNLMTDKQDNLKSEVRDLKKQVKDLEKELDRKEKAMAEVVALLVLKKNWMPSMARARRTQLPRIPARANPVDCRGRARRCQRTGGLRAGRGQPQNAPALALWPPG